MHDTRTAHRTKSCQVQRTRRVPAIAPTAAGSVGCLVLSLFASSELVQETTEPIKRIRHLGPAPVVGPDV
jgi:hypothetical protein